MLAIAVASGAAVIAMAIGAVDGVATARASSAPIAAPQDSTVASTIPTTSTDSAPTTTTVTDGSTPDSAGETGAVVPPPAAVQSEPLVQYPPGCDKPPVASVVFVGTVVAKDYRIARYRVEQVRAGDASHSIASGLIDIQYDNETQFLKVNQRYLVGAAPVGAGLTLNSKVREVKLLFGGNAIIGLTEKSRQCPTVEDPIRTLRLDGSPIDAGMLTGLTSAKKKIAWALLEPLLAVAGIVLVLVLIRWLFAAIFVSVGRVADGEPLSGRRRIT